MTGSDAVTVDADGLRTHARKVESTVSGVPTTQQAAEYLAGADDGYGLLVAPYAASALGPLHERITARLRELSESTGAVPGKLRTAADAFTAVEQQRVSDTERAQGQLEGGA